MDLNGGMIYVITKPVWRKPCWWNDELWFRQRAGTNDQTFVRKTQQKYDDLDIDLPGFKKDEISIQLDNGYLNIQAAKGLDKDEEKKDGQYIRRERYAGSMSRTFYVGDALTQNDIHAKFEDGILRLTVPKKEPAKIEQNKYIAIE